MTSLSRYPDMAKVSIALEIKNKNKICSSVKLFDTVNKNALEKSKAQPKAQLMGFSTERPL